jgi:hypothetical protein
MFFNQQRHANRPTPPPGLPGGALFGDQPRAARRSGAGIDWCANSDPAGKARIGRAEEVVNASHR